MAAALELGRRQLLEPAAATLRVTTPHDIGPRLVAEMADLEQECLRVVLLDNKGHVLGIPTIYVSMSDQVFVSPRDVFRVAVRRNATSIIVAHNHPGSDPAPSHEDIQFTRELVEAGKMLDIAVLDHLIVARGGYTSLARRGKGFDGGR